MVTASLVCLAEAGLLDRLGGARVAEPASTPTVGPPVTAIVVLTSGREIPWLSRCLESIARQRYMPLEIVLVDNASDADFGQRPVLPHELRVITLRRRACFAKALNCGLRAAAGEYLLFLNPDAALLPGALAALVARAGEDRCAAVAPKTRFRRAPAFLNGIGNRARLLDWGCDNAIGHLDLGQFDGWRDVPSASLTAMLATRRALGLRRRTTGMFKQGGK